MFQIDDVVVVTNGVHSHKKGVIEAITPNKEAYVRFIGQPNWALQADFVPLSILMHYEYR